jgi:hypothetical protein
MALDGEAEDMETIATSSKRLRKPVPRPSS